MLLDISRAILARHKADARDRRTADPTLSHARALEAVARANGARDWNTLSARSRRKVRLAVGDRVQGRYLGQPFTARVHAASATPDAERMRIALHFDTPVDVVTFDSFSSYRQRVSAMIGPEGRTRETTSEGTPHLELTGWHAAEEAPQAGTRA